MVLGDGYGTPMVAATASASVHEVKLIEPLVKQVRVPRAGRGRPRKRLGRLIYDKAADSDPLRERLKTSGTDLIAPQRDTNASSRTAAGLRACSA